MIVDFLECIRASQSAWSEHDQTLAGRAHQEYARFVDAPPMSIRQVLTGTDMSSRVDFHFD